jgi:hypothetical protein
MSAIPLRVISGVRSLAGSHPIFTLAVVATEVLTLQYSIVLDTCKGGVSEVGFGFGVKYSAVQYKLLPAVDVSVKL